MEKHTCKTYFSVDFEIDLKRNAELLKIRRDCLPEEIGIFDKDEVEKFIIENFDVAPEWRRHHFVIGNNENYDVDVNEMIRITLKKLFGREKKIREMCERFCVKTTLEIVPHIVSDSEEPNQLLSPDGDIIEVLYKSGTSLDIDYYVI